MSSNYKPASMNNTHFSYLPSPEANMEKVSCRVHGNPEPALMPIDSSLHQYYYPRQTRVDAVACEGSLSNSSIQHLPSVKDLLRTLNLFSNVSQPSGMHNTSIFAGEKVTLPPIHIPGEQRRQSYGFPNHHYNFTSQREVLPSNVACTPTVPPATVANLLSPTDLPSSRHHHRRTQQRRNSMPCRSNRPSSHDDTSQEQLINSVDHFLKSSTRSGVSKKAGSICEVCGKDFKRPSALTTHMVVHNNDKPYKCEHPGCGKCFNVKSNMLRHMRKHRDT